MGKAYKMYARRFGFIRIHTWLQLMNGIDLTKFDASYDIFGSSKFLCLVIVFFFGRNVF